MIKYNRRNFIKSASLASIGTLGGIQSALTNTLPSSLINNAVMTNSNVFTKYGKSKRDLMLQVLDMSETPNYIPAGFFMHFGVQGDAAIKAHLDYFRTTGMDFVKIQFDEFHTYSLY